MTIISEHFNTFYREINTALETFYALKQFNVFLFDRKIVNEINKNSEFWAIFESSLLTKLFIGVRRLYDSNKDSFNYQFFVRECEKNIEDFSSNALKKRKLSGSANSSEWIDVYMQDVYEPNIDDFYQLSKIVRENSKKVSKDYTNVASKFYAHNISKDIQTIREQLKTLDFDELEKALLSLWHLYNQTWQMFENGRKPNLKDISHYPYVENIERCIKKQLAG